MADDKTGKTARLLCVLSTVLLIICNLVAPVAMFLWFGAATPQQQDKYAIDVIGVTVISCGAGMQASISITDKYKRGLLWGIFSTSGKNGDMIRSF